MSAFAKNGLDMDAPETWPDAYQKAHAYGQPSNRWCCVDRMVNNPPTTPYQTCRNGHPLSWHDPNDPERGWIAYDDETGERDE